jgi:RimJ/RimL family protein N-acetyltransferase
MTPPARWPTATVLTGRRLVLEPLRLDHADEMAAVLDDPALHEYTGGTPATATELRFRYSRLATGFSADGSECWLNWVVRHGADAVGFVQATVTRSSDQFDAEVAWVIGTGHQHHGYAQEAAALMVEWLRQQGARNIFAHIHPEHVASAAVARRIGLFPTDDIADGEILWVNGFPA